MDSTSRKGLSLAIRDRILDFAPLVGATLRVRLGGGDGARLYQKGAPDNATFPLGIIRLINDEAGTTNKERVEFDCEIIWHGKDIMQASQLEEIADVCDAAFLRYTDPSSGVIWYRGGRRRDDIPPSTEAANRGMISIRQVFPLIAWPRYLTDY
jgi:hypothetical protein